MKTVEGRWEIIEKSRCLISSSRQLLQELSGRFQETPAQTDREATDLHSHPPVEVSGRSTDDS